MLTVIKTFSGEDINILNEELWRFIYQKGSSLHFGGTDETKDAREIFAVIQVYGKALKDLYEGKLPKGWKFGEAANKVYIEMLKDPDKGEQPYTYGERLHHYPVWDGSSFFNTVEHFSTGEETKCEEFDGCEFVNQLENARLMLREDLKSGIQSNRNCGIIWNPLDIKQNSPPCFQWYQARKSEGNRVSLRILFRSNDAGNAVFANMGAVIRVFVDEVIEPEGAELEELIWIAVSEHEYLNDMDMIESLIGKVPDHLRRMLK